MQRRAVSLLVVGARSYDDVVSPSNISKSDLVDGIELHSHPGLLWVPDVTGRSPVESCVGVRRGRLVCAADRPG